MNIQVEGADVVVLNKAETLPATNPAAGDARSLATLMGAVRSLNPTARLLPASFARVDLGAVLGTGLFESNGARDTPDNAENSRRDSAIQSRSYSDSVSGGVGIGSFVYERRDRPFHPARLHDLVSRWTGGKRILRAKG